MPILIDKPECPEIRSCNVCHKRDDVKEICFNSGNIGVVVALCKGCRKELIDELKRNGDQ